MVFAFGMEPPAPCLAVWLLRYFEVASQRLIRRRSLWAAWVTESYESIPVVSLFRDLWGAIEGAIPWRKKQRRLNGLSRLPLGSLCF